MIHAHRGDINEGYIALDDFTFRANEEFCSIKPTDADPAITTTEAVTSTTSKPSNTFPNCQFEAGTCGWELFGEAFHWITTDSQSLQDGDHDRPSGDYKGNTIKQPE